MLDAEQARAAGIKFQEQFEVPLGGHLSAKVDFIVPPLDRLELEASAPPNLRMARRRSIDLKGRLIDPTVLERFVNDKDYRPESLKQWSTDLSKRMSHSTTNESRIWFHQCMQKLA